MLSYTGSPSEIQELLQSTQGPLISYLKDKTGSIVGLTGEEQYEVLRLARLASFSAQTNEEKKVISKLFKTFG